jgi:transposase
MQLELVFHQIDTLCMNVYLQEFSVWLGDRKVFLIIDGVGWHKAANLLIPHNIKIIYLAPYSPELNPVERLWQNIKDNALKP